MYYFIVYTDHMGLTRSGSFRVVPDFSTSHSDAIRALPVPEIEALSLTKLHTSGGRRNM